MGAVATGGALTPVLDDTKATTLASIILIDDAGGIVTGVTARGSYATLPEVSAALGGRPMTVLRRNGDSGTDRTLVWSTKL